MQELDGPAAALPAQAVERRDSVAVEFRMDAEDSPVNSPAPAAFGSLDMDILDPFTSAAGDPGAAVSAEALASAEKAAKDLREEVQGLKDELSESQETRRQDREASDQAMQEIKQRAKDHIKQLQDRARSAVEQKEARIQELEAAREAAGEAAKNGESAEKARSDSLEAQLAVLRAKLNEEIEARAQDARRHATEAAAQAQATESGSAVQAELSEQSRLADELRLSAEGLRAELREKERQIQEAQGETRQAREESEVRVGDIVRKAKEHVQQLQTRLSAAVAESRDVSAKHRDLDEQFRQQQEKVTKFKQLMSQANARIEESDSSVGELREALSKSQADKIYLQERLNSMDKDLTVPPCREDLARFGIQVAVEAENDDVWCLISARQNGSVAHQDNGHTAASNSKSRWWLLSQLDTDEKPMPLQRRWKGEVSALRAQMTMLKRRSEEVQEEFDSYRQKAGAALQTTAGRSEGMEARERKLEQLGEQLQARDMELQRLQAEKAKATEALALVRRQLQDAQLQHNATEQAHELRLREAERNRATALEACEQRLAAEKSALEQSWCHKERDYQQELDLRKAQRDTLEEEVESLRTRLAKPRAPSPELPASPRSAAGSEDGRAGRPVTRLEIPGLPHVMQPSPDSSAPHSGRGPASDAGSGREQPSPKPPTSTPASQPSALTGPAGYSLAASAARQDLAALRSRMRQLEMALEEEKKGQVSIKQENESLRVEVREMQQQELLSKTVSQHQHMEYIRNVFRKFIDGLPPAAPEREQLIPVLMAFFQFPDEDARAMQLQRRQAAAPSLWGRLVGT